jgi:hypothetical protein
MQDYFFNRAYQFLIEAEKIVIIQEETKWLPLSLFHRFIFFPFASIQLGFWDLCKIFSYWTYIVATGLLILKLWLNDSSLLFRAGCEDAGIAIAIVAALIVAFSAPSLYKPDKKFEGVIGKLVQLLQDRDFRNEQDIKALRKQIDLNEAHVRKRIFALKWIAALPWAIFLYGISKTIDLLLVNDEEHAQIFINYSIPIFVAVLVIPPLVLSYEKGIDRLYQGIELALCEMSYKMICQDTKAR